MTRKLEVAREHPPGRAIRKYCLWCCGGSAKEVRLCPSPECDLYRYRLGAARTGRGKLKAIRRHCVNCVGGEVSEVQKCSCPGCPLFIYRMGRNPRLKGKRSANRGSFRKTAASTPVSRSETRDLGAGRGWDGPGRAVAPQVEKLCVEPHRTAAVRGGR